MNDLKIDFQNQINEYFYEASDVFTIQEEITWGSNTYEDVDVRITTAISQVTGEKLSDDFKTVVFKDIEHSITVGKKYYFDSDNNFRPNR